MTFTRSVSLLLINLPLNVQGSEMVCNVRRISVLPLFLNSAGRPFCSPQDANLAPNAITSHRTNSECPLFRSRSVALALLTVSSYRVQSDNHFLVSIYNLGIRLMPFHPVVHREI